MLSEKGYYVETVLRIILILSGRTEMTSIQKLEMFFHETLTPLEAAIVVLGQNGYSDAWVRRQVAKNQVVESASVFVTTVERIAEND